MSKVDINEEEKEELKDLVMEFRNIFAESPSDLRNVKAFEYEIDTGTHPPIQKPIQRKIIADQVK